MFIIERDNALDLEFEGALIAAVESSPDQKSSTFSGSTGRWTVLSLYRTEGGKYVCHQAGVSQWEGERTRNKAVVADTEADVIAFFGTGWLAKSLYADAGINAVEVVR